MSRNAVDGCAKWALLAILLLLGLAAAAYFLIPTKMM